MGLKTKKLKLKISYHTLRKSQDRKRKNSKKPKQLKGRRLRGKIFLLSVLKIPYLLLYKYTPDTRCKFAQEYPCLSKLYTYLLEVIGNELNLPVKRCFKCAINFLPDPRSKKHQTYCPYGCVEANRRENKQKAKNRYRKKHAAKMLASEYNCLYRLRKKNGEINLKPQIDKKREKELVEKKLRAQIKFFYTKLNPHSPAKKNKQLDNILEKLSQKMAALYS